MVLDQFTDDEGFFQAGLASEATGGLIPDTRLTLPDRFRDQEGAFVQGPAGNLTGGLVPDTRLSIPGTLRAAKQPVGREVQDISTELADLATETTASAARGAAQGLFDDLQSGAGTLLLLGLGALLLTDFEVSV